MLVSLPLDIAVGIRLRDTEDSIDAVGSWPLPVRRIMRRKYVLLLLHGVMLIVG